MMTWTTRSTVGRRAAAALAATLAALLVASCSGGDDPEPQDTGQAEPDQITYMTGFGDTSRENFARVAIEKGFFDEVNIEVSLQTGAGGDTNHTALAAGEVHFAAVDSSGALTRYVNGTDDSFQILAAVQQLWPMALLGFTDTGIERPRDLNGKTIGLGAGTIAERIWPAWAEVAPGLDASTVEVIPTNPQSQVGELVAGQLDAIALFSVSAPGVEQAGQGRKVTAIPWTVELPDMYGNVIIAQREFVEENPDVTARFMTALMRGLEYMLEHPDEAAQILVEALPENAAEVATEEVTLMREFCYGGLQPEGKPLGYIDRDRIVRQMSLLESVGEITGDYSTAIAADDEPGEGAVNFLYVPGAEATR